MLLRGVCYLCARASYARALRRVPRHMVPRSFRQPSSMLSLASGDSGVHSTPHILLTLSNLGHYNLFDKGVLHWDISTGNILHYSEPVKRPALDKFECTRNLTLCRGFLIDGDQAIKWREFSGSQSISVCGWNYIVSLNPPDLHNIS